MVIATYRLRRDTIIFDTVPGVSIDAIAPSSPPYNLEETKKYSSLAGTLVVCFDFQSQKQITYQSELYRTIVVRTIIVRIAPSPHHHRSHRTITSSIAPSSFAPSHHRTHRTIIDLYLVSSSFASHHHII